MILKSVAGARHCDWLLIKRDTLAETGFSFAIFRIIEQVAILVEERCQVLAFALLESLLISIDSGNIGLVILSVFGGESLPSHDLWLVLGP